MKPDELQLITESLIAKRHIERENAYRKQKGLPALTPEEETTIAQKYVSPSNSNAPVGALLFFQSEGKLPDANISRNTHITSCSLTPVTDADIYQFTVEQCKNLLAKKDDPQDSIFLYKDRYNEPLYVAYKLQSITQIDVFRKINAIIIVGPSHSNYAAILEAMRAIIHIPPGDGRNDLYEKFLTEHVNYSVVYFKTIFNE